MYSTKWGATDSSKQCRPTRYLQPSRCRSHSVSWVSLEESAATNQPVPLQQHHWILVGIIRVHSTWMIWTANESSKLCYKNDYLYYFLYRSRIFVARCLAWFEGIGSSPLIQPLQNKIHTPFKNVSPRKGEMMKDLPFTIHHTTLPFFPQLHCLHTYFIYCKGVDGCVLPPACMMNIHPLILLCHSMQERPVTVNVYKHFLCLQLYSEMLLTF